MPPVCSPAKINLFLAVTGRRADGFHELVSVVAPLAFGDRLEVSGADSFSLECDDPAVPVGEGNLVLKAAQTFRKATGWKGGARFRLEKRIPMGAGLGGGSSNAASALMALNDLAGKPLKPAALLAAAAEIGSDCPLFVHGGPVVIRGRGEKVTALDPAAASRIRGRRLLLFMPTVGIGTPWAYSRLAEMRAYLDPAPAEARLDDWRTGSLPLEKLLFNSLEAPVIGKFPGLGVLMSGLRRDFGFAAGMSGSGSCCFALLPDDIAPARVGEAVASLRAALGPAAFITESRFS